MTLLTKCAHCGAERMLYHRCPKCGLPTFKERQEGTQS